MKGAAARPAAAPAAAPPLPHAVVRWSLYVLVMSIPFEIPHRSIPLEVPTITAALFLLAACIEWRRCYARGSWPLLGMACFLYVAAVAAVLRGPPEYLGESVESWLRLLQGVLVFLAAANLMRDERVARAVLWALAAACVVRAALPLAGIGATTTAVWTGGERLTAFGQNANNSAMILAAGLVALLGVCYRPAMKPRALWLCWPFAALLVVAVVETGSRGGLAALAVGVLAFTLARGRTLVRVRNGLLALAGMGLVLAVAARSPVMRHRLEATMGTGTMAGRERIYPELWRMIQEQPMLGWGPVANKYELGQRLQEDRFPRRDSHNLVLEVLSATGVLGTIPFLVALALCLRAAWQARRGPHGVLPLALLLCVLAANMSGNRIASKLLWLALAYALASGGWVGYAVARARRLWTPEHLPLWPPRGSAAPGGTPAPS